MGNSASKAISKATPKGTKPTPSLASKVSLGRTLPPATSTPPPSDFTKNAAIQADGQDPTFMQNLNSLGAVTIPRSPTLFRSDNRMLDILAKRKAVEEEAETPAPNRLSSQALSNLLDDRKAAATREEVEKLAKEYGMTMEVLEELGRHINAPSVSSIKSLDEELEDAQLAIWVDAKPSTLYKKPEQIAGP